MNDLFKPSSTDNDTEEIKSYKEALVGEGKKFKDEEALARAKWEADNFIKKLEEENHKMRTELNTRMTLEDFWEKTKAQGKTNEESNDNRSDKSADQVNAPTKEQLAEMVRQALNEETSKAQRTRNVDTVRNELSRQWGANFVDKLNARSRELGASPEYLAEIAETQPQVFLALMVGKAEAKQDYNDYAPPRSAINSRANANSNTRNYAYYSKMRKEDPTSYRSPKVQMEMFEQAKKMGEDFYKS